MARTSVPFGNTPKCRASRGDKLSITDIAYIICSTAKHTELVGLSITLHCDTQGHDTKGDDNVTYVVHCQLKGANIIIKFLAKPRGIQQ
jgi:hypothetical protein